MEFRIIESGAAKSAIKFEMVGEKAVEMEAVFYKIYLDMMRVEEQLFISQGRRGGGSWVKLKESTVRKKGTTTILFTQNNFLANSLTKEGAPGQVILFSRDSFEFGTDVPEAEFFSEGTSKQRARPLFKFTNYDRLRWDDWILQHLIEPFVMPE